MTLRLQDGVRRDYCTTTENTTVFFTWTDYVQQVDLLLPIKKMKHLPISVSGALLQERISNTMLAAWASSTACAAMRRNSSSSWPNFRVLFDWPLEKCLYMLDDGRIHQRPGYSSSLACRLPPPSFCVPLPEGNNTIQLKSPWNRRISVRNTYAKMAKPHTKFHLLQAMSIRNQTQLPPSSLSPFLPD